MMTSLYIICLLIVCLQMKLELSEMNVKIKAVVGLKVKQLSPASQINMPDKHMAIQLTLTVMPQGRFPLNPT